MTTAAVEKDPFPRKLPFIRKFSLSSKPATGVNIDTPGFIPKDKTTARSTSGPVGFTSQRIIAGPPYQAPVTFFEQPDTIFASTSSDQPVHETVAPSRQTGELRESYSNASRGKSVKSEVRSHTAQLPPSVAISPERHPWNAYSTERRSQEHEARHSIFPALASPPSSSSRRAHLSPEFAKLPSPPSAASPMHPTSRPPISSSSEEAHSPPVRGSLEYHGRQRGSPHQVKNITQNTSPVAVPKIPSNPPPSLNQSSSNRRNNPHRLEPSRAPPHAGEARESSSRLVASERTEPRSSAKPNNSANYQSTNGLRIDIHDVAGPTQQPTPSQASLSPFAGESEASAYAKAVSNSMLSRQSLSPTAPYVQRSPSSLPQRRSSRPLPKTPQPFPQKHPLHVANKPDGTSDRTTRLKLSQSQQDQSSTFSQVSAKLERSHRVVAPDSSADVPNYHELTHLIVTTSLPAVEDTNAPDAHSARESKSQALKPVSVANVNGGVSSSPRKRDVAGYKSEQVPAISQTPSLPVSNLNRILSQPRIQAALLSQLTINSLLSLLGASDTMRKVVSGELVGRWVLAAWDVAVHHERGRSWPNLQVWEGFLESLLHDPSTYTTYPKQWQPLLQHLCLSHTLIVLLLRTFPSSAFPEAAPSPFEDESTSTLQIPASRSASSLISFGAQSRSRVGSFVDSDSGSVAPMRMPRQERLIEIAMPEPLAAKPVEPTSTQDSSNADRQSKLHRRGSITSIASAKSFTFSRKRSNSVGIPSPSQSGIISPTAVRTRLGKIAPPPISYPTPKRYGFSQQGGVRSRTSSESTRPGSIMSMQSSPSIHAAPDFSVRGSSVMDGRGAPRSTVPMVASVSVVTTHRGSLAASDPGRSSRQSDHGTGSSSQSRWFPSRLARSAATPLRRVEPAFDLPIPYIPGRAPLLRIFVPLSDRVRQWPSAEGAVAAVHELNKCGALKRLQLGDLVINTAIRQPQTTEHVLLFVPFIKHKLVPLEYKYCSTGHLPAYLDAFTLPPSYYHPFLPSPQILFLDLAPFAEPAQKSLRLAFDRRDVITASGAILNAKRYLHVTGFEVNTAPAAQEWFGMVTLEAEGTAEGRRDLERRIGSGDPKRAVMGPWEVVREKSMLGAIWLRLVPEAA